MYINYRSIENLNEAILKNLHVFPHDVDLVVGIPRSGMLPANLLAMYLNKPYTDIDSFLSNRIYQVGSRSRFLEDHGIKKVLVIDDSINYGTALGKCKEKIKENLASADKQIYYAAIYASSRSKDMVDFYCEIIDGYRMFQWNFFHHSIVQHSCFDIDGVLCQNPPMDDDGPIYTEFIKHAPALYIPTVEIDMLVSCRLEKYREVTEEWLRNNNVKYKKLVMLDFPDKETRVKWGKHGEYKGQVYKKCDNYLFVESSLVQAKKIFEITNKPVFCIENFSMINNESVLNKSYSKIKKSDRLLYIKRLIRKFI